MNLETLHRKLLRVARLNPPSEDVPYAFEQRILARIRSLPPDDPWLSWAAALWRATVPCFFLLVGIAVWNWSDSPTTLRDRSTSFAAEELEVAVVDSIDLNDNVEDSW